MTVNVLAFYITGAFCRPSSAGLVQQASLRVLMKYPKSGFWSVFFLRHLPHFLFGVMLSLISLLPYFKFSLMKTVTDSLAANIASFNFCSEIAVKKKRDLMKVQCGFP